MDFPRINQMGERAILIELEPGISENQLEDLLSYKELLENYYDKVKVEIINSYDSLLIYYLSTIEDLYGEVLVLKELLKRTKIGKKVQKQLFKIPVCYDLKFGLDLPLLSMEKGLPVDEIIRLHTGADYTVYFTGFLPGFLYLGGLDPKLCFSRKNEPRMQVQKGAVGIGEKQTGIYPKTSPGGWQIIGNSPVSLFNKNTTPPCEILAGDRINFFAVNKKEYNEITLEVQEGNYQLIKENFND